MKIIYLTQYNILRPTTNRIFDMRLCDGFAGAGVEVEKIAPSMRLKENIKREDIRKNYGMEHDFPVKIFHTPLHEDQHGLMNVLVLLVYYFFISIGLLFSNAGKLRQVYFLSRDPKLLLWLTLFRKVFSKKILSYKLVHIMPEIKKGKLTRWIYKNIDGFLASNSIIRDNCYKWFGIPAEKFELLLAPIPAYKKEVGKEQARSNIGYHSARPLVVYTGKLGHGLTEIEYYLQAAKALPHYQFLIGGGRKKVVGEYEEICRNRNIQNILFPGFHNDSTFVRNYQLAADVLVSYYTKQDHNVENSFPQKLTEYMTTGNPVVTPDYPATRDVITSDNVFFAEAENASSLIDAIRDAVENKEIAWAKAARAKEAVKTLTFDERCKLFIRFLKTLD